MAVVVISSQQNLFTVPNCVYEQFKAKPKSKILLAPKYTFATSNERRFYRAAKIRQIGTP